jgi:6-phosphogluconolactonase (cycloisomerase 2 family)
MRMRLCFLMLSALAMLGCRAGIENPPAPCFTPQPGVIYLDRDAIFVANTGSSSVSAFQLVGPGTGPAAGGVCGSPFHMDPPPTALGGGGPEPVGEEAWLIVLSGPQKTILLFRVDFITSVLTGPVATFSTAYTPMAVAVWENYYYMANAEGNVSVYQIPSADSITEIPGSPFPAGGGPVGIAAAQPGLLYIANSQSNNVTGYILDPNTGVPTPLPGSPFPAGTSPSSIEVAPAIYPNPAGGATLVIVTNQGSNNVSVYSVAGNGALAPVPGSPFATGAGPSSSATGNALPLTFLYVANSKSSDISGYSIDDATGTLTPLAGFPFALSSSPSSVVVSIGRVFLYAVGPSSNGLSVFQIGQLSGALTPVSGSPFPVGQGPHGLLYFQVPE